MARYNREERRRYRRDPGPPGARDSPWQEPARGAFPEQRTSRGEGEGGWDAPAADDGSSRLPPQAPPSQGAGPATAPGNGMAVAGFVLSILALILSWLSLIDLIFLIPAIVFSAIGLRKANRHARPYRGLAISGLSISLVAAVVMIVLTILIVRTVDDFADGVSLTDDLFSLSDDGVSLSEGVLTFEDDFFDIHLEVEVVGITRGYPYPGGDLFLEPGNEWVRIVVEVENLSGDDHRFRGFDFDLVDADGEAFGTWVGHPDTGDLISDKTIPARSVARGDVVRQAPISVSQMALAVDVFSFDTQYLSINLDSLPTVDPPAPAPPAPTPPPDGTADDPLPTVDPPAPAPPAPTPPPDGTADDPPAPAPPAPTPPPDGTADDPPAPAPPAPTPPPDGTADESLSGNVLTFEDDFFDIHLEVEVVGITRGYPGGGSGGASLEPGNEWVRVVVEVENLSGDDHRFRGFDFDLVDADGEAFGTWVGHPDTGDLIVDKTIPARSVTRGDVVRQAPISASQMALAVDVFSFDTRYLKIDLDSLPTVDPPAPAPPPPTPPPAGTADDPLPTVDPPAPAPPAPTPPPAETLADCRQGMTLQPGEACRYTGGDSPPATVVLSVDRDGAICREGGPARRFGATIEHIRLCTNGFDRDDTFNTNIRVRQNPDSSWEVTSSP